MDGEGLVLRGGWGGVGVKGWDGEGLVLRGGMGRGWC